MDQDAKKEAVAQAALAYIRDDLHADTVIGVGTGTTADRFIDALVASGAPLAGAVASSEASARRLAAGGIRILDANDAGAFAIYVDGADEIDASGAMIKGGGGALTREKIVAACAETFVCIVDDSKCVQTLGAFPLPLEVIPMARALVARNAMVLGGTPSLREGVVTDNGNVILDVSGLDLRDPGAMERRLNDLIGLVANGLFALRGADLALVSTGTGVETRTFA